MYRNLSIVLLALFTSSCLTASWAERRYEPEKGGILSYLASGADSVIESRREDALEKMEKFCSPGSATVTREFSSSRAAAITDSGVILQSNHAYIDFRCI